MSARSSKKKTKRHGFSTLWRIPSYARSYIVPVVDHLPITSSREKLGSFRHALFTNTKAGCTKEEVNAAFHKRTRQVQPLRSDVLRIAHKRKPMRPLSAFDDFEYVASGQFFTSSPGVWLAWLGRFLKLFYDKAWSRRFRSTRWTDTPPESVSRGMSVSESSMEAHPHFVMWGKGQRNKLTIKKCQKVPCVRHGNEHATHQKNKSSMGML